MSYTTEKDLTAKAAVIYDLLAGYHQLTEKLTDAFLDSFVRVVDDCRPSAVASACKRIGEGRAPGVNSNFPPTPADVAISARLFEEIEARGEGRAVQLHNGLIEMDWGRGRVDMRGLTADEQDRIIDAGGMIGGQNAAMLTLEEKRAALQAVAIGNNAAAPAARIQRMTDK